MTPGELLDPLLKREDLDGIRLFYQKPDERVGYEAGQYRFTAVRVRREPLPERIESQAFVVTQGAFDWMRPEVAERFFQRMIDRLFDPRDAEQKQEPDAA